MPGAEAVGEKPADQVAARRSGPEDEMEDKTAAPASPRSSSSSGSNRSEFVEEEQPHRDLAREHSNAESIWLATTLTLPREFLFVSVICLTQFCTRKYCHFIIFSSAFQPEARCPVFFSARP